MKFSEKLETITIHLSQGNLTLIMLAGLYLLYLVYGMVKGMLDGTGSGSALIYVFAGLFTVCGLLLCLGGVYALWRGWYKENSTRRNDADNSEENSGDIREE